MELFDDAFSMYSYEKLLKNNEKIETYPKKPYSELQKDTVRQEKLKNKKNKYNEYQNSLIYYGTMKQRYLDKIKAKKGE